MTVSVLLGVLGFTLLRRKGPRWTEPFIAEDREPPLLSRGANKQASNQKTRISGFLLGGLVLRIVAALYPLRNGEALLASIPWVLHGNYVLQPGC